MMRVSVPLDDPNLLAFYGDLMTVMPKDVEVVQDDHGTYRFKANALCRWLADQVSLNDMAVAFDRGEFSLDEYMRFYRDIGYSLSGFVDVFRDRLWPEDAE